jgi:hypothetical protein
MRVSAVAPTALSRCAEDNAICVPTFFLEKWIYSDIIHLIQTFFSDFEKAIPKVGIDNTVATFFLTNAEIF